MHPPPSPARANFTLITECTPESSGCNSVYSVVQNVVICSEYRVYLPSNPLISITPSKPLMSSGSWLTLHNCEFFYLLAVNYDPATTDLIFIRVNIYPGAGEGGSQLVF
jgi:hypothetical protein